MSDLATINKALANLFPPTRMEVMTSGKISQKNEWSVVVNPRGEGDLASVLRLARTERIPLRIGGRTEQGKTPVTAGGAIRVDMTGMDRVISLDEESYLIRVQAGISIAVLKSRLSERKLMMGWSIYSAQPHTLGAVLAGGVAARWGARYGKPADSLRSLTAVLPDGGIVSSPAAPRRAAGPDLSTLMVGTHGRLGIISEVTLRVYPWPEHREVLSMEFEAHKLRNLGRVIASGISPNLIEIDVGEDGIAHCIVYLTGATADVVRMRTELVQSVDGTWEVEPGLVPRMEPASNSIVLTWGGLAEFLNTWEKMKSRESFHLYECTGSSLRISGGNVKAIKASLAALSDLRRDPKSSARNHLAGVKMILDADEILGPLEGGAPTC